MIARLFARLPARFLALPLLISSALAADLTVTADHADGVYAVGEIVTWTISGGTPSNEQKYSVKFGGRTNIASGKLSFTGTTATVKASLDKPGTMLLNIKVDDKTTLLSGAVVDWANIKPSAPEPTDFDEFWKEKLGELAAVPVDPTLEEIDSGNPKVSMWKLTMNNIRGTHIYGYLARPKGNEPCPAMLQVQYAGLYPLEKKWTVDLAQNGWLALNIIAHDLPVDKDAAWYANLTATTLKDYAYMGSNDREKSYFLRMFTGCYRAADYLATRPDWNKKSLVVQGASQGGFQTVVTAALHPAITMAIPEVPAGCDLTGALVDRKPGWPQMTEQTNDPTEKAARYKTSPYFDIVNFAARVRCPVLVGMGLIDMTCPSAGVFAMYNRIPSPKRIVIMPNAEHSKNHEPFRAPREAWLKAGKAGVAPPLN